ncbi:hypothetical protein [Piscirickettsia litoralis]|uniref:hypothetical protein n=1 Tax=Piscirickettsia litoralis TaxID=1891921 RepID=UPI000A69D3D5|nr:hypothetical protein [Piscirickettsia litoralis]
MEQRTLSAWLAWAEQQHADEMCFGLERVKTVAESLELLNVQPLVITVGGTNGKGSCIAFLRADLCGRRLCGWQFYFSPLFTL